MKLIAKWTALVLLLVLLAANIFPTNTLAQPVERDSKEMSVLSHTVHAVITRPLSSIIAVDYDLHCSNPQNLPPCSPDCSLRESTVRSFNDFYFNRVMWSEANFRSIKALADLATRTCAPNDINGNQMPGWPCYNVYRGDPPPCNHDPTSTVPGTPVAQESIDAFDNSGDSESDSDENDSCSNPHHYPPASPGCTWQEISNNAVLNFTQGEVPQTEQNYKAIDELSKLTMQTCIPRDKDGNRIKGKHFHISMEGDPPPCPEE
ncbi:MAG: hypothetical protein Q9160_007032 [Pyrenula sp. 1 TL-2023]